MNTDVGVMIVTAIGIGLIVAVGYLYLNQKNGDAALPSTPGSTSGSGTNNSNAWQRVIGSTFSGLGTGLAGGGL